MNSQDAYKRTSDLIRNSATVKIVSIGLLILLLLIPSSMVSTLIHERESRKETVVQEINQKWGSSQIISGPFFTLPFKVYDRNQEDQLKYNIQYLYLLPEKVEISGDIEPHIRYRSIYEAVLYHSKIIMSGNFAIPNLGQSDISPEDVLWDKAIFSIGITDMKGIKENIVIRFNDQDYKATPGLKTNHVASSGVQALIPLSLNNIDNAFSFHLYLNGSHQLHFTPVGETTNLTLKSSWPSPSFNGSFLPSNREITNQGFTADWAVLHFNRNYPQFWTGNQYKVNESSFGVELIITADLYQKAMRISKYSLMFIVFTFSAFFFAEIINRKRVHPIQYLLIGLAVILFYVLLLSISEHFSFDIAYLISAIAITTTITSYSKWILKSKYFTVTVCGILIILYSYLYIVLQLEDYALLMGSIGLFIILTTVMYITRKIDWYNLGKEQNP